MGTHPHSNQNGSTLTSDHLGTHAMVTSEWLCTYIWSCGNTSHSHIRMALIPRLSIPGNWLGTSIQRMEINAYIWSYRNQSYSHIKMAQNLYETLKEPILSPWHNGSALKYDHGRNQSSHHVRMDLSSRLSIPGNWQGASIQRMAFITYIWSCWNQSYSHLRMAQHLYLHARNQSSHHDIIS